MNYRLIILSAFALWLQVGIVHAGAYVRAVTYFGAASPLNYWNSAIERSKADFEEIKTDGFNAIVLVVPWGEFQPGLRPARFNDDAFNRLKRVCQQARAMDLQVHLRVSYLLDMYPGVEMPGDQRAIALLNDNNVLSAWKLYLQRIAKATEGCANGYFLSWEDFWIVFKYLPGGEGFSLARNMAKKLGYNAWISKNASDEYRKRNQVSLRRNGYFDFPERHNPDFKFVFSWFDEILMHRLLPTAQSSMPMVSLEPRMDDDPIYNGNKRVSWYSHKKTYTVRSSPFIMGYWAPAMGALNQGELEPAAKVITRFAYIQNKVRSDTRNKIFLDQFLYQDNTPTAANNARIHPDELSIFLVHMAAPLLKLTSGYALWGARDYDASMLFNGFFSLAGLGWESGGSAQFASGSATLAIGASIRQMVPEKLNQRAYTKQTRLRILVSGPGIIEARFAGVTKSAQVPTGPSWIHFDFPVPNVNSYLDIASKNGQLMLREAHLYDYTQVADFRDPLGKPGPRFTDIRTLNKNIASGANLPTRLAADDQSLRKVSGVASPEIDGGRAFAWAGPDVRADLFAAGKSIRVIGHIKPSMFPGNQPCKLVAYINTRHAISNAYEKEEPIELNVPIDPSEVGTFVTLQLKSNCSLNPKKSGLSSDSRDLSYVLREISSLAPSADIASTDPSKTPAAQK